MKIMEQKYYCKVEQLNSLFKVQEGCCYEQVVYAGNEIGIIGRIDRQNEFIGILLCRICDPDLTVEQISEAEYYLKYQQVNILRLKM